MPETVKRCINCGRLIPEDELICLSCGSENEMQTFQQKVVTNADKIRAMDNEQLAEFLAYDADAYCGKVPGGSCCFKTCLQCAIDWLKKEAEP